MPRHITPDLVRQALSFISPDIGHDDRARVAFAVWDGLGDGGADLWLDWAASRSKPDASEDRDTWRSARRPGKVRVGTLFGMAKDRGFTFPAGDAGVAPSPEVLAQQAALAERRERERKAAEAQYRERSDQAARVARGMWGEAQRDGAPSPYLQRKGVGAHSVRTQPDGTLLVPMRNGEGVLQNVQRVAPVVDVEMGQARLPAWFRLRIPDDAISDVMPQGKTGVFCVSGRPEDGSVVLVRDPHGALHVRQYVRRKAGTWLAVATDERYPTYSSLDDGVFIAAVESPEKRYLPGGRKQGLFHLIGASAGVCTRPDEPLAVLLLAEGYATGASVHEATGRPLAVCFDSGNLKVVAEALREQHPAALLVVCGDDDAGTAARTGENPGRKAAASAVRAVATPDGPARAVFPAGLTEDGTDFNDLHAAAGLDAVRDQVELVIAQALDEVRRLQLPPEAVAGDAPLSDFERDCLAGGDDAAGAPWDADVPLDELVRRADEAGGDDDGDGPSPPGADAAAPTPAGGGGAADPAAQMVQEDDAAAKKKRKLLQQVDALTKRFSLIYSTDTAWDAREEMIVRVPAMRLTFGREAVNLWLARPSRRLVMPRDLVFEPGLKVADHQINMWSGLDLEPTLCTADEVAPMLALLRHLCSETGTSADDVDAVMHWILCWQALPLQRIGTKMQTACIFHGAQGTGKNLYWDIWRDLFGDCGITVGQVEIEDKFNGWISRKLAIIGDEVATRSEMYHNKNRLKLVVTQESKFPIRGMQQETRWESNHANVVFLSNESQPLVLEERDRRYMVVYTPLEADVGVYEAVRDFRKAGGMGQWLHYLQSYDVGEFGAHTKPLMTQAKLDLIELGWRGPERFAYEWVEGFLDLPLRVCSAEQLYRAFRRWCDLTGEKYTAQQAIFTRSLERWVKERVARDPVTQRFEDPRLTYKQIGLKDEMQARKTVRCWVPRGTGPLPGISEGEWAHESCKAFERDLARFVRRSPLDADAGGPDGGGHGA